MYKGTNPLERQIFQNFKCHKILPQILLLQPRFTLCVENHPPVNGGSNHRCFKILIFSLLDFRVITILTSKGLMLQRITAIERRVIRKCLRLPWDHAADKICQDAHLFYSLLSHPIHKLFGPPAIFTQAFSPQQTSSLSDC